VPYMSRTMLAHPVVAHYFSSKLSASHALHASAR